VRVGRQLRLLNEDWEDSPAPRAGNNIFIPAETNADLFLEETVSSQIYSRKTCQEGRKPAAHTSKGARTEKIGQQDTPANTSAVSKEGARTLVKPSSLSAANLSSKPALERTDEGMQERITDQEEDEAAGLQNIEDTIIEPMNGFPGSQGDIDLGESRVHNKEKNVHQSVKDHTTPAIITSGPGLTANVKQAARNRKRKLMTSTLNILETTPEFPAAMPTAKHVTYKEVHGSSGARKKPVAAKKKVRPSTEAAPCSSLTRLGPAVMSKAEGREASQPPPPRARELRKRSRTVIYAEPDSFSDSEIEVDDVDVRRKVQCCGTGTVGTITF
jgi:hypothetical protein